MAYLAFDEFGAVQQAATADWPSAEWKVADRAAADHASADRPSADRLSALEWAVVVLARRDTLASLREPGRLSVALGNVFARRSNPRLADPRLEALRRLAVLTWHDRVAVPAREMADFLAAGFTPGQYHTLVASIRAATFNKAQRA